MCSCDVMVNIACADIDHTGGVGYGILPVISENCLLCEVKATRFQETSPGSFH